MSNWEQIKDRVAIKNDDCMEVLKKMKSDYADLVLTDIPYGEVNRDSNGLRTLDKDNADVMTFEINAFLDEVYKVAKSTIIIFCGKEQLSLFFSFTEKYYSAATLLLRSSEIFRGSKGIGDMPQQAWSKM